MANDEDESGGAGTGTIVAAVVVTFAIVTPLSVPLLGVNWTQAAIIGGFAAVVSAASAVLTAKRTNV